MRSEGLTHARRWGCRFSLACRACLRGVSAVRLMRDSLGIKGKDQFGREASSEGASADHGQVSRLGEMLRGQSLMRLKREDKTEPTCVVVKVGSVGDDGHHFHKYWSRYPYPTTYHCADSLVRSRVAASQDSCHAMRAFRVPIWMSRTL